MAGVGLYLARHEDDVIFPSREGGGGAAIAIRRYVTRDESAQRVTDRCQACNLELTDAERSAHPHLFRYGCHYSTDADGFCGPCFRSSETGQALRDPAVHSYGGKCRLSTPAKREAWAVALGVLRAHATLEVHNWAHIEVPRGVEAPGGVQRSAAELTQLRKRIVFTLFGLVIP